MNGACGGWLAFCLSIAACAANPTPPSAGQPASPAPASEQSKPVPQATSSAGQDCDPLAAPTVSRFTQTGVRYCGRITKEGVESAAKLLKDGDERLVITSGGGELEYPLDLALIVLRRQLDVEVVGPCLSGCASFVFVAGRRRFVPSTGIIGFHNTASSAALLAAGIQPAKTSGDVLPLFERSKQEFAIYAARRVGVGLLFEPQARIKTLCLKPSGRDSRNGEAVFDIVSEYDFWLPTTNQLESFGVVIDGSPPRTVKEAERRFADYMQPIRINTPKFTMDSRPLGEAPDQALHGIPLCEAQSSRDGS